MRSVIDDIKEKLSIIDVVGTYVELHRAGKSYKGKSPFTNERTPSFYVSPDRGMYYCFSSNQGGDMFTFVEAMEGVDFKGALKILAEKAGVELVAESPEIRTERDRRYALLEEATAFFFKKGLEDTNVQEYLKKRGVTSETLHTWRIGFAIDAWRGLRGYLKTKGYSDDEITKAGLTKRAEKGKEPYDVFRNRVMFPICASSGAPIAFSGRTLSAEEGIPKYVNSPETELFKKSEVLFGYHLAKQGIRKFDFSLVVEGQFDVVLAHQAGYTNTVAVSGTAFTDAHIALISRLSSRAVLALDSDRAGIAAAQKSAYNMLRHGMDVKVACMIGGKDPADIILENKDHFKKYIAEATHAVLWLTDVLKEHAKDERAFKLSVRREVLPLIAVIPDAIDREHFEGEVSERIATTRDAVHGEVERLRKENEEKAVHDEGRQTESAAPHVPTPVSEIQPDAQVSPLVGQINESLRFFAAFLAILRTEDKKRLCFEKTDEAVQHVKTILADVPSVNMHFTDHDINNYIASRTRAIKKDFEETVRDEHPKMQAGTIAHELGRLHKLALQYTLADARISIARAQNTEEEEEVLRVIQSAQKDLAAIHYTPEMFL